MWDLSPKMFLMMPVMYRAVHCLSSIRLFSCSRFDVILLSVLKEIALGICLLWIVPLLSLYWDLKEQTT